ncbi:MAG: hypothetical protein M3O62_17985 [Pseudomonadota bacterium]|nr:hypothetical protein [Pseudomonadota bacterium]
MRIFPAVLFALAAALAPPAVTASEAAWQQQKDKDGIQIHTRPVAGWTINEVRGVTRIDARLSSIVAVLEDPLATPELADIVEHSEVRDRESATRYQIYSMMKMPWPVSDRDILNQREISQDPKTHTVTITDIATANLMPLNKDYVRIVKSRQQWTLTPLAAGGVQVESLLLSDPAGPIPASIINAMSISTPFNSLSKLRELALRPKYVNASLPHIAEAADTATSAIR